MSREMNGLIGPPTRSIVDRTMTNQADRFGVGTRNCQSTLSYLIQPLIYGIDRLSIGYQLLWKHTHVSSTRTMFSLL